MISTLSKKYTKALISSLSEAELTEALASLQKLASVQKISKFQDILVSKELSMAQKEALLMEISSATSAKNRNFIALLLQKKRVDLAAAIADEIREYLSSKSGKAYGKATASFDVSDSELSEISRVLGSKLNRSIELSFSKVETSCFNGIKVEIEDLGAEIEINKNSLKREIVSHILNTSKIF